MGGTEPGSPELTTVDIEANRAARKWTSGELVRRAFWEFTAPLFAAVPRQAWSFRNAILRLFGAQIGQGVRIHPTVRITVPWNLKIGDNVGIGDRVILYSLGEISIGSGATVSQNAHLCAGTHDYRQPALPLVKQPIAIGQGAWICADAFLGPGVVVGDHAIVGARAVVIRPVTAWTVVAGNPAQAVGRRPPFQTA
jgi:putative colanic acid biosynthesis acetyltransferase WcaF